MITPADFPGSSAPDEDRTTRTDRAAASRREAAHDARLVRRFNSGEEPAFEEIVTRYRVRMFTIAFAALKNHADAEEIAQDTFIRAHRALAKFRGDSSLSTWLHRIAVNLTRNRYWYFFRRRRHASVSLDSTLGHDSPATFSDLLATTDAGPTRQAMTSEFLEFVAISLRRLSATQREILTLRNTLSRSYEEIAHELGISVGTVKSRIARARVRLRDLLAETYPEFGSDAHLGSCFDPIRPTGGIGTIRA